MPDGTGITNKSAAERQHLSYQISVQLARGKFTAGTMM